MGSSRTLPPGRAGLTDAVVALVVAAFLVSAFFATAFFAAAFFFGAGATSGDRFRVGLAGGLQHDVVVAAALRDRLEQAVGDIRHVHRPPAGSGTAGRWRGVKDVTEVGGDITRLCVDGDNRPAPLIVGTDGRGRMPM